MRLIRFPEAGVVAFLSAGLCGLVAATEPAPEIEQARRYFQEAQVLWKQDAGRLWGLSLEGPMLFADRQTHRVVANQKDEEGRLRPEGDVFVGQLPAQMGIANTALDWAGKHWTMVAWPLPKDPEARAVLMMHESWHRVQDRLGFPGTGPKNSHLDTLEGRFWLQLEWQALKEALVRQGDQRRAAIQDALLFRGHRRSLFKEARAEERALEMHEGLAEYTGIKLSGMKDAEQVLYTAKILQHRPSALPTFVRSFAYLSGPAYGLLLDATGKDWRKELRATDDLGTLLQNAMALTLPVLDQTALRTRSQAYDGLRLRAKEEERDQVRQKQLADYRRRFVDQAILILPLQKMQISFDPGGLQPLEGVGMVYATARLTDVWGILTCPGGVLVTSDFSKAVVSPPKDPKARPLKGEGWELELNAGWSLQAGKRQGDYVLTKDRP